MNAPVSLEELSKCLAKLPGVGRRSAERMALKLVRDPDGLLRDLAAALEEAGSSICCCSRCGTVTTRDADPCRLCIDAGRDDTVLCVVEDPNDIVKIEDSGGYRGRYHALMGRISPMKGVAPDDLRVDDLLRRVMNDGIEEVILALNTDVESDATASYVAERLRPCNVKVSRLAFGLPAGSGIAYSDPVTLARAIKGRQDA